MENRVYYYARVSTKEQNLDRQIAAFVAMGAEEREIITDKESGKSLDRPGYQALKNVILRKGDTLVVKSLDRLSRCFVGAALIRRKADEPSGLRSKRSPGGRSSQVYCLGTRRIFRTALVSESCRICLRQIAFVPNAGRLTLRVRAAPTAWLLS